MVMEKSDFQIRAQNKVKEVWHMYVLNTEPEKLMNEIYKMSDHLSVIGTGSHELYETKEAFVSGMMADRHEAQAMEFEILDQWYAAEEITQDVCVVYGAIWMREKSVAYKPVYIEMDSRFSIVCKDTKQGVIICHIHHSIPYLDQREGEYYPKTLSALAEEVVRKNHILERRVKLDSLTELYNRVSTECYVSQAMKKEKGIFFMLDLDDFKTVNNTVGHLAGDRVIQAFSCLLREVFYEKTSLLGRMGGDEFAVWVLYCDDTKAQNYFDSLIEGCRRVSKKIGVCFSCSAGVADSQMSGEDFTALYKRADKALYEAKKKGKCQAVFIKELIE